MKINRAPLVMSLALIFSFTFVFIPVHAFSQTTSFDGEAAAAAASLTNAAQVQKAENLAQATADKAQAEIEKAENNVAAAEKNLASVNPTDTTAVKAAEEKLADAVEALNHALANSTGVSASEISDMRASGMGWGQIAHALGLHPGTLGLGHTKSEKDKEQAMATSRDFSKGTTGKEHGQKGSGPGKSSSGEKGKDNASEKGSQGSGKGSDGGGKGGGKGN